MKIISKGGFEVNNDSKLDILFGAKLCRWLGIWLVIKKIRQLV